MDITPALPVGRSIIHRYRPTFRVSGKDIDGPIIVTSDAVTSWVQSAIGEWTLSDLCLLFSQPHDVVLIGTGSVLRFPDPVVRRSLRDLGHHAEFMTTDAACRTFNVLVAEGRDVLAALLPFHPDKGA